MWTPIKIKTNKGTYLEVQWLRLTASNAGGAGLILIEESGICTHWVMRPKKVFTLQERLLREWKGKGLQ